MQGLFFLVGLALVIAGLNSSASLAVVGGGLIVLAIVSRLAGRRSE